MSEPAEASSRRRTGRRGGKLESATRDRVIVLTGASSGIGEATAHKLARVGATVALIARRQAELERVAVDVTAAGGRASVHPCDLADLAAVASTAADVLDAHGRADVLVNNAGRSIRRPIRKSYDRIHDFERTIQLNYLGAVQLTLGFLPTMRERKQGHIVNISSFAVQGQIPRFASYVASKAALDAFADCVAAEVRHDNVRFTTVHMPLVRTEMIAPTRLYRYAPSISPERAAEMICDALIRRPAEVNSVQGSLMAIGNRLVPKGASRAARSAIYRVAPD